MKVLRPFTIVPSSIYVERAADRQVESIIESMGRPGYVLVARQMGKTNLLLNAKRKRDNCTEVFTYFDVSNPFPDARSFFRNIIDLTLETASGISEHIKEEILSRRMQSLRLAHIEHEWELRQILRSGISKLIICLDEIDALTRSEYSDHVFSFIRSVYFSGRSNFSELENLTYLLSGVAEPADIIKNKDISPFNIGEKIYLDDFNMQETEILLQKAGLHLSMDDLSRLYFWIRGYPRMTWDVCALLEEHSHKGVKITSGVIDDAVKSLYFSGDEPPPLDHIKRLVEESIDIRDALVAVHYDKGHGISDAIRARLYLTGISCYSSHGDSVRFKNAVLEQSLSESYLLTLSNKSEETLLENVIQKIKAGQIHQGLEDLKFMQETASESQISEIHLWRGRAYFQLEDYEPALLALEVASTAKTASVRCAALLYSGVIHYREKKFKKASEILSEWESFPEDYRLYASIWYAQSLIEQSINLNIADHILLNIISDPSGLLNSKPFLRMPAEALAHSYIARAEINLQRKEIDKAKRVLEDAVSFATADLRLKIYLMQAENSNESARLLWLRKADRVVHDASDFRILVEGENNSISTYQLGEFLAKDKRWNNGGRPKEVLDRIFQDNVTGLSVEDLVKMLVEHSLIRDSTSVSFGLVERAIEKELNQEVFGDGARQLMGILIRGHQQKTAGQWGTYVRSFGIDRAPYLSEIAALNTIVLNAKFAMGVVNSSFVLGILNREPADAALMTARQANSLEILRKYLGIYIALFKSPAAGDIAAAKKLLVDLESFTVFDLPAFRADHPRLMQEGIISALKKNGVKPDLHPGLKFGRNEYVQVDYDGEIRVGKYKKFEFDLLSAKCKIIGRASRGSR